MELRNKEFAPSLALNQTDHATRITFHASKECPTMSELNISGWGNLRLAHVGLDVNGTFAKDGRLLDNVARPLTGLRDRLNVHLLTADTYGRQDNIDLLLGMRATRIKGGDEAGQKAE